MSSFFDLRRLSRAFKRRLLLLGYCSTSLLLSFSLSLSLSLSAGIRIDADFRGSEGYWEERKMCVEQSQLLINYIFLENIYAILKKGEHNEHTRRWPLELLGVVGRLEWGVVDRLEPCVFGLLESEPERKSGNRCGETDRLSALKQS